MARRKNTDEVHEILRSNLQDEIEQGISPLRDALFPKVPRGMKELSQKEYINYIYDNWATQEFRVGLLKDLGPRHFSSMIKTLEKAKGQPPVEEPLVEEPVMEGLPAEGVPPVEGMPPEMAVPAVAGMPGMEGMPPPEMPGMPVEGAPPVAPPVGV